MDARRRPDGWREALLATLHPLSREAFHVRREPLSEAEAEARRREFAAIEWRMMMLDLLQDLDAMEARCDDVLLRLEMNRETQEKDTVSLPGLAVSGT